MSTDDKPADPPKETMLGEFKKFAFKGNVVDLAVGVIIGGAFGNVVKALTDWMIMPFLGLLTGGIDFTSYYLTLKAPKPGTYANMDEMVAKGGAVIVRWGAFINTIITFLLVAMAVFFLVKAMNRAMAGQKAADEAAAAKAKADEDAAAAAKAAEPTKSELLLEQIRDLLKQAPAAPKPTEPA